MGLREVVFLFFMVQVPMAWAELVVLESPMPAPQPDINWYRIPAEPRSVDTVVIHHASAAGWYNADFQNAFAQQLKPIEEAFGITPETLPEKVYDWRLVKAIFTLYGVSAHYIIDRDGTIIRLVPEVWVAWHAGHSKMPAPDNREMVNSFAIGIELLSRHPDDAPDIQSGQEAAYTPAQYEALEALLSDIQSRWDIQSIVGHDEIAPARKTDPGPLFDWSRVRNQDRSPKADSSVDPTPPRSPQERE